MSDQSSDSDNRNDRSRLLNKLQDSLYAIVNTNGVMPGGRTVAPTAIAAAGALYLGLAVVEVAWAIRQHGKVKP